jgi:hypothetical protein
MNLRWVETNPEIIRRIHSYFTCEMQELRHMTESG